MLHPVILCGGSGQRLWPASRPSHPKPFLPLVGAKSSFIGAVERAGALPGALPAMVIAGQGHEAFVRAVLADQSPIRLVIEPEPRNTAAAVAAAALIIGDIDPEGVLVVLPADHHIPDHDAFAAAISRAADLARDGWIAILGLKPTSPATGYGYIRASEIAASRHWVSGFIEKPDAEQAALLVAEGCLWNCGVFVGRADVLLAELGRYAPRVLSCVSDAVSRATSHGSAILLDRRFGAAPALSFDVAVMERTDRAVVVPANFGWSDLGDWDAVLAISDRDAAGNSTVGQVVLEGASDCLVRAGQGMTVVVAGGRNLAVIADREAVMVCDLDFTEGLKAAVERASQLGEVIDTSQQQ